MVYADFLHNYARFIMYMREGPILNVHLCQGAPNSSLQFLLSVLFWINESTVYVNEFKYTMDSLIQNSWLNNVVPYTKNSEEINSA